MFVLVSSSTQGLISKKVNIVLPKPCCTEMGSFFQALQGLTVTDSTSFKARIASCTLLITTTYTFSASENHEELEKYIEEKIKQEEQLDHIIKMDIFYSDSNKAIFRRFEPEVTGHFAFMEKYDFQQDKITRIFPYLLIPQTYIFLPSIEEPKIFFAFYMDGEMIVWIEMNLEDASWKELCALPKLVYPKTTMQIPDTDKLIFAYEHEDYPYNNDVFSMATLDTKTCEFTNILTDIICQNHPISSAHNRLVYLVLDRQTILYIDTGNPWYFFEKNGIPEIVGVDEAYNQLWLMSIPSQASIRLATDEQRLSDTLTIEDNRIIWNGKVIGLVDEIKGQLTSNIRYFEKY